MKKLAIITVVATLGIPVAQVQAGSPFAKLREKKAAEKAREREEEKEKENPPAKPDRPKPDRDKDHDHRDKDRDNWKHPRTVIIERPVYVPSYPNYPVFDPYNLGRLDYDSQARREDALLEAVAQQMRFALRENEVLKAFKLDTDTVGDSVEIHGTVDNVAQMQLALDVARNIDSRTRIVLTRLKIRQK